LVGGALEGLKTFTQKQFLYSSLKVGGPFIGLRGFTPGGVRILGFERACFVLQQKGGF